MNIVNQVINRAIGEISDDLKQKRDIFIDEHNKDMTWNNAVQEAITNTEGIDEEIGNYIFRQLSIENLKMQLFDEIHENIHRNFILTLAMELCQFNKERDFSISLGGAVLDTWLTRNKIALNSDGYDVQVLNEIINDREKLYRNYFKLFEEKNGVDKIRVFYPKNGESWIRWEEKYSIEINVNLSKGLAYGFSRIGFDYHKIMGNSDYKTLKCAYIGNGKEILRFDGCSCCEDDLIIWVR